MPFRSLFGFSQERANHNPRMNDDSDEAGSEKGAPDWSVVCVTCLSVKRNGAWTTEKATTTGGRSTGYCDACMKLRRADLGLKRPRHP